VVSNAGGMDRKLALRFLFDSNEQMVISPFRIEVSTEKTMFIVANILFIKEIKRSCLRAL